MLVIYKTTVLVPYFQWVTETEYSGRNLAEYSAETVSVKIMGFGNFAEYLFTEYSEKLLKMWTDIDSQICTNGSKIR